jgi:hypothetical protein
MNDTIMGLHYQGILHSSFMGYIYDPRNNILNIKERYKYRKYYNDRHLMTGQFVNKYIGKQYDEDMICELAKRCFKTYSSFVKFVTTIERHKNSRFGGDREIYDQKYGYGELVSYEDAQRLCMDGFYTETLLPENRNLVGLYIHSRNRNFYLTSDTDYETYKMDAIKKATELNLTLYSLEERRGAVPP